MCIMKNTIKLLFLLVALFSGLTVSAQGESLSKEITSGRWVNRSDGYVVNPTYNPKEVKPGEEPNTVKRFKTFNFNPDNTFTLDSAKQRYTGRYTVSGNEVQLEFNPVVITKLSNNLDTNVSTTDYSTERETVQLTARSLQLNNDGN